MWRHLVLAVLCVILIACHRPVGHVQPPDTPILTMTEKDNIRSQLMACWIVSVREHNSHNVVRLHLDLQANGTVTSLTLVPDQQDRYNSDKAFRNAADRALRAVTACSPLKGLPPNKYEAWRDLEITFDPSDR
jgi:hypothetical protein